MLENNPTWYKDAIIYQLHVRAMCDTNGSGTGDFTGATQKLDYLQDLGINAIWLMPFYPSPLKDDGYDIANYTSIHPNYGTVRDFKIFLDDAHRRGIRVITELVLNHTSDQHPWFQRARRAPAGSSERNFYVWSDDPSRFNEVRIIFRDFEPSNWTWDSVAKAHFWHRFYSHQPDLNYDNPEVRKAMFAVVDFWLGLGVDGMRLDAVPYLYERDGTNCENLPETHEFLRELRRYIDTNYPNRMLLSEANQWPEDAVAYFGDGDQSHMAFHFPLMPRMFMSMHMEDRFPLVDILNQTPAIPETAQWAVFLRNHDELTLEMVTDEERDYMYRTFARDSHARINVGIRRRLAPLLDNNRRRIELMNGLLFSLPGTPVIYYGDEIGMGDNIYLGDRNTVRTPMQWSSDRNAGFSQANPQRLYLPVIVDPEYHYETVNVEAQQNNLSSLLWWMKRWIALRKQCKSFGRGTIEFLHPRNHKVLAFLRQYEDERILVVANLSRFAQFVELDLAEFAGHGVVELFGRNAFPRIENHPYLLTLAPYAFFWFLLDPTPTQQAARPEAAIPEIPLLPVEPDWDQLLKASGKSALERTLAQYLLERQWLEAARPVRTLRIIDGISIPSESESFAWVLIRIDFLDGESETYVLSLAMAAGDQAASIINRSPNHVVARLQGDAAPLLYDATINAAFSRTILDLIRTQGRMNGMGGELTTEVIPVVNPDTPLAADASLEPDLRNAEQGRPLVVFGNQIALKFCRKAVAGIDPDLEVGRFLTQHNCKTIVPPVLGWLEYRRWREPEPVTLAILRRYLKGVEDAWEYTVDAAGQFFERVLASRSTEELASLRTKSIFDLIDHEIPQLAFDTVDTYLDTAHRLGQQTARLHLALASDSEDPIFAPEPFTPSYQRSLYQSMRTQTIRAFAELRPRMHEVPENLQSDVQSLLQCQDEILGRYYRLLQVRIVGTRIRCHGDYHLKTVLHAGKDFAIVDFDGHSQSVNSERRIKHSPLRDVTSMLRSFHYAVHSALYAHTGRAGNTSAAIRPEDVAILEPWARYWYQWVAASFLKAYQQETRGAHFLPDSRDELQILGDCFSLFRASRELTHEVKYRLDWLVMPVKGLLQMLERPTA